MQTTIVLVRHAVPVIPAPGGPDEYVRPLVAEGLAQAQSLVPQLAALAPAAIWSSPYLRAIQTVAPTAAHLGLTVATREDLREWDAAFEPTPNWGAIVAQNWADPSSSRPGGESLDMLSERAVTAICDLASTHQGQTVLVGSHGSFTARALCGFGVMVDSAFHFAMPMPAVYHLRFTGQTFSHATGPGLPSAG